MGRPVENAGPLAGVGDLPGGGVLRQVGNGCGTCSLSAVLRHFGVDLTQKEIDRVIRNLNVFTAPDLMVKYARGGGFEAVFRNRGTISEVKWYLDRGIPVVLLVDTQPGNPFRPLRLHYVTAISYRGDGGGFRLGIYNPWGLREEVTAGELEKIWKDVRIGPFICWDCSFVAIAPIGTDLGPGRPSGARGVNMLGLSVDNAVNGVVHVFRDGRFLPGIYELAAALPQSFIGFNLFMLERLLSARSRLRAGKATGG